MIIKANANLDFEKNVLIVNEEFQPHTEIEHEYLKLILEGQLNERNDDVLVVTRTVPIPADAQDKVKLIMLNKERASKNQPPLDELPDEKAKAVTVGGGESDETDEERVTRKHRYTGKH